MRAALARARQAELQDPRIYSHSIAMLLHEPGPQIAYPYEHENWPGWSDAELNHYPAFVAELSVGDQVP